MFRTGRKGPDAIASGTPIAQLGAEGTMNQPLQDPLRVYPHGGTCLVLVPNGRGEELRVHLASHGVAATVYKVADAPYERLEADDSVDAETLQAILDSWER